PGLLLHVRRERPCRRATDETDKFPPPHCLASGPRGNSGSLVRHSKTKSSTSAMGHVWTAPWQELSDVCAALVGCGHVSGLLMRRGRPLALMLCADRVPIVERAL
ncbi:MAG: hypothetical protein WBY67_07045, partial [Pseudolabrys sp.]